MRRGRVSLEQNELYSHVIRDSIRTIRYVLICENTHECTCYMLSPMFELIVSVGHIHCGHGTTDDSSTDEDDIDMDSTTTTTNKGTHKTVSKHNAMSSQSTQKVETSGIASES
jgi:hypothetical protein